MTCWWRYGLFCASRLSWRCRKEREWRQ